MGPRQLKRRFDELCQRCFHSRSISHGGREREPDAESIPLAVKDQPFEGDAWDCRESPLQYQIVEEVLKVPDRFRGGGRPLLFGLRCRSPRSSLMSARPAGTFP